MLSPLAPQSGQAGGWGCLLYEDGMMVEVMAEERRGCTGTARPLISTHLSGIQLVIEALRAQAGSVRSRAS